MPAETQATMVAERYALTSQLGQGGMGVVWRAEDTLLKRQVAVKEIRFPVELQEGESQKVGERVLREARAAAQLNHPGAVAVYDVLHGENKAFIVMELVDAPTLDEIVKTSGAISEVKAAEIALSLLDTLDAAHAQGIIHRDVKPANVMVAPSGDVKLADFGIASVRDDPRLTASGMILGSPAYMAPEQAKESPATPATDLWSLGATLFTAVEGRPPFGKGNAIATLGAVLNDDVTYEKAERLRPLLDRLLAKDPEERPSSAEARAEFLSIAEGGTAAVPTAVSTGVPPTREVATEVAPKPSAAPTRPVTEASSHHSAPQRRAAQDAPPEDRSNRWLFALGLAVLFGVLAWLAVSALRDDPQPKDRSGAAPVEDENEEAPGPGDEGEDEDAPAPAEDSAEQTAPENWSTHTDPATGYEIAHPDGWSINPVEGSPTATDFRDDSTGTYMRVEWTDTPGDDVVGRLEEIEARFSSERSGYEGIRIEPVDFLDGWDAAEWEYVYEESGAVLHAVNLQFVNGEYGFALNFQTRDQNWDVSQEIFEDFKASFSPPS